MKQLQVGVFFSSRMLTLVMTGVSGKNAPQSLINWACIPLPDDLDPDSEQWVKILEQSLSRFTAHAKKVDFWCAIEPSMLKIKHIVIPDMPMEKVGNAAFWGLKRETDFDETTDIFDFELLEDEVVDGVKKKNLIVFSAGKNRIHALKKMFDQAGYPLCGITAIPFALQNFVRTRKVDLEVPYFAVIHISQDTSDIYCFSRAGVLLVRSLRTGALNLIEGLDENPEMAQLFLPGEAPETPPSVSPQVQEVSERLVSKIIRTGDYCAQHYTGNTPITHYYFLGEIDMFAPFMDLAQNMIPGGVKLFEPLTRDMPGALPALPEKKDEHSAVLVAWGLALSGRDWTPNFIHTHQDKQKQVRRKRITTTVCLAGGMILAALVAMNLFFFTVHKKDLALLDQLDRELTRVGKDITPVDIDEIVDASKKKINHADVYIDRYRPLGVIYDLCRITPPHIRLTSLAYGKADTEKKDIRTIRIQGQITGPGLTLEAELAHYILSLSASPVFGNIQVTKERTQVKNAQDQLLFSATLEAF
ncbi:MAG: hypothetical protein K9K63_13040 [Desulfotignum sp.]|nr:hypothetical protein [Desulfotignum sp.]MCF8138226.1 hypothetical protein [Desulfotignum sp.]